MPGVFIAIEGINGSGKTTQTARITDFIQARGHTVTQIREPGATALGEAIREIIKSPDQPQPAPMTQLLLYNAARAQMLAEVARPALEDNQYLIADRFTASTVAYQAYGQGLDPNHVIAINKLTTGTLQPDLTILLDLPLETARLRTKARGTPDPKLDLDHDFHQRVRHGFIEQYRHAPPHQWQLVDATQPVDNITRLIITAITDRKLLNKTQA